MLFPRGEGCKGRWDFSVKLTDPSPAGFVGYAWGGYTLERLPGRRPQPSEPLGLTQVWAWLLGGSCSGVARGGGCEGGEKTEVRLQPRAVENQEVGLLCAWEAQGQRSSLKPQGRLV